jgi:hypothetical protein
MCSGELLWWKEGLLKLKLEVNVVAAHFSDEPLFDAVHWWGATSFFLLAPAFLSLQRVLRVSSLFRVIACSGNRKTNEFNKQLNQQHTKNKLTHVCGCTALSGFTCDLFFLIFVVDMFNKCLC